jgi:hypothetical protein
VDFINPKLTVFRQKVRKLIFARIRGTRGLVSNGFGGRPRGARLLGSGPFLRRQPESFRILSHCESYGGQLMQIWELTYEIVGSAILIGALLFLLWFTGFVI